MDLLIEICILGIRASAHAMLGIIILIMVKIFLEWIIKKFKRDKK